MITHSNDSASTETTLVDTTYERLHTQLSASGQDHVLGFWHELSGQQQAKLVSQIEKIDLEQIDQLYRGFGQTTDHPLDPKQIAEPVGFALNDPSPRFTSAQAVATGEAVLRAGTVGVVIVAGGQGTRLGFDHPKGMFPIGPVSGATLFEILLSKVRAAASRYGTTIPVYVMTSPATHDETAEFLAAHQNFGLGEDLSIFCQGTMPAVSLEDGRLLLSEKDELFESPDGHGGMLGALDREGAFADMNERGIEHLFYMQIDNALVDVASPEAIGYHVLSNSDATTMVIRKEDPLEKVGNVAVLGGKTQIIEYSDLPEQVAKLRHDDGGLQLWAGNVAVHVWDLAFLQEMANTDAGLPFHYAQKKVAHVDTDGHEVKPESPNGLKFERFIFDLLPMARKSIVIEVDRASYFAPLKNPVSAKTDNEQTVKQAIGDLHRQWLTAAGATVEAGVTVEIHPSFAATAEEVAEKVDGETVFNVDLTLE